MKKYFNFFDFKTKRKVLATILFILLYLVTLLISINYAERKGVCWLNPSYTLEIPQNQVPGFYTVDISQPDELTKKSNQNKTESNVNIGEIHHLPNMSEFELFLYDTLAKNGGYLTDKDMQKLKTLHTKVVSQPGTPIDQFYDFLFQDKGEDYLTQKLLLATENSSQADMTDEVQHKLTHGLTYSNHKVKEGETLWNISRDFGVSIKTILSSNQDVLSSDGSNLKVGITLRIPNMRGIFIKAAKGDTISKIAKRYNIPKKNILIANKKTSDKLRIGEKLFLPGVRDVRTAKERHVKVEVTTRRGKKIKRYISVSEGRSTPWKGYFAWPLRSRIALSSRFGVRRSPFRRGRRRTAFHAGIDLRAPRGTPIYASAPGQVTFSGWRSGYGKTVEITHSNGIKTIYAHCTRLLARTGQSVGMGQTVGTVGATGRATGSHLHFEVRVNGIPRNPFSYLK